VNRVSVTPSTWTATSIAFPMPPQNPTTKAAWKQGDKATITIVVAVARPR